MVTIWPHSCNFGVGKWLLLYTYMLVKSSTFSIYERIFKASPGFIKYLSVGIVTLMRAGSYNFFRNGE